MARRCAPANCNVRNLGQLVTESHPSYAASYTYDANGNRLTKTLNGATDTYSYDTGDKLQSVVNSAGTKSYTYDSAGRTKTVTTSAGTTTFNYDLRGHVTSLTYPNATTDSYAYTGTGARAKRTDPSGTRVFLRDGLGPDDDIIYDDAVNYTPHISEHTTTPQDRYYNPDAQGSLTDMTDLSGNTMLHRTWDAFGNSVTSRWLHGWHKDGNYDDDWNSGLKMLGNRYYDQSIGRFLTPDPAGVGSNWYAYCGNNPNSGEDPSGLISRNIHDDGTFDDAGGGSDNRTGWFSGGFNFGLEVVSNGLDTGLSGVECVFSLGIYDGGARRFDDGFVGSRNLAAGRGGSCDCCSCRCFGFCGYGISNSIVELCEGWRRRNDSIE